jgi:hypothetical protein
VSAAPAFVDHRLPDGFQSHRAELPRRGSAIEAPDDPESGLDCLLLRCRPAALDVVALNVLPVPGRQLDDGDPLLTGGRQAVAIRHPLGDQTAVGLMALFTSVRTKRVIAAIDGDDRASAAGVQTVGGDWTRVSSVDPAAHGAVSEAGSR